MTKMTVNCKKSFNFDQIDGLLNWMGEKFLGALGVTDALQAKQILNELLNVVLRQQPTHNDNNDNPMQLLLELCCAAVTDINKTDKSDDTMMYGGDLGNILFCAPQWQQKREECSSANLQLRKSTSCVAAAVPTTTSQGTGVFIPKTRNPSRAEQQLKMIHSTCESILCEEDEILGMQEIAC